MTRVISTVAAIAAALAFAACGSDESSSGAPVTLNFWAYNEPGGTFREAAERCTTEADGRYEITFNPLGNDPNTPRQSLVRRLAAEDSSIDIMSMDVIWTAEFAQAGWVLPWPEERADAVREGTLEGPIGTATYEDRLWAAPANSNTQLLWYREDLVDGEPPTTWSGLIDAAAEAREAGQIEVQGADYEGIVVWFTSLIRSAGGEILEGEGDDQRVALPEGPTKAAIEVMADLGRRAANPSIQNQREDQNRLAFEEGNSIFQINYPFIFASARDNEAEIFEDIGFAPYPRVREDEPARAPIGGFNWGVGGYTEHPEEAFDAATCMRNEDNQRNFADAGGLPPTLESIYDDPGFGEQYPFGDLIREQLETAAVRPPSPFYADVSLAISTTLAPPTDIDDVDEAYETLREKVADALESKGLL